MTKSHTSLCLRHSQAQFRKCFLGDSEKLQEGTSNKVALRRETEHVSRYCSKSASSKWSQALGWDPKPRTLRGLGALLPACRGLSGKSQTRRGRRNSIYFLPFSCSLVLCYCGQHIGCLLSPHHRDASVWPQVEESWAVGGEKKKMIKLIHCTTRRFSQARVYLLN